MKPITLHLTAPGPNPWKVAFVLEELNIPYEFNSFPFQEVKNKPYIDICPNGRVPAIQDPNTGITLWESGAIILYLIETYDKSNTLTYSTSPEKHHLTQWLMFQMSGQGPYFGQAAWFNVLHPERIPSAMDRYKAEIKRILGVLNGALEGRDWLVGDKMTYADLSFVPWNDRIDAVTGCTREEMFEGFDNVKRWMGRMWERPAWKKCIEERTRLMDEQGLMPNGMPKGVNNIEEYEEWMKKANTTEGA